MSARVASIHRTGLATVSVAWSDPAPEAVMIGALALGALSQMPPSNITSGEDGFLFCLAVAVGLLLPATTMSAFNHLRRTFRVEGKLG